MTESPTRTSNTPRRGFSAFINTWMRSLARAASIPFATLVARDLKAPHCLQASMAMDGNTAPVVPSISIAVGAEVTAGAAAPPPPSR
eukprot:CAMPEP_0115867640 /NCGR_PEP_ID=MMETSP0287-20121206/20871_1 /TAXON_ID=412157 /ORGANISM="Chrysochromulina rotalis, Strain UIO044" /LENGTH=86 /DNA_ID=CAMNT_0003322249 /DNA_START=326 /DNA_END=586 /DNA_ORIENTATION=-